MELNQKHDDQSGRQTPGEKAICRNKLSYIKKHRQISRKLGCH